MHGLQRQRAGEQEKHHIQVAYAKLEAHMMNISKSNKVCFVLTQPDSSLPHS